MTQGYRPQLDGLRAIAIGLVGVEHFGGPWVRTHFPIGAGALGVELFFVLSGFLITRNLLFRLEQAPAGEVIRRFYIGRAVRLMPAYYLTLLVLFVLGVPEVHDSIRWHLTYTSNYLAATGGPLLVFWSLAVEEQFYLMLPVLLLISGRNAMRVALFLIATGFLLRNAVLATPIDPFAFELSIFGKFEILGIGVLIGALFYTASRGGRRLVAGWNFGVLALACLLFQAVAWYFYGNGILRHVTFNASVGTFFAWVVLRADAGLPGLLAWFSGFAFVRFIGKISYGIYLTHAFFPRIFESSAVIERVGSGPIWAQGICVLVLSVAVPATSWYLMESPLLKLKERLLDESPALVQVRSKGKALKAPAAPAP
ncbi:MULTISPECIES: acyltransferase [unclassified Mesorhizobium]|uniref:acyltransferase family protein n=1 Tax=unclassified Mesorhizobium TaxID=325217 RepID=UPI000FD2C038|nr:MULTISPECIES: acyltransferase [unclassified Mesorhizobium]RVB77904.1 acyltransferase [Mesorhizobium sp. M6A.T.Cr.TU.014.01.1.1]RWP79956.1 MAG: acyltransferase [Mesorhizobium sp.]RWQ07883.1 MAG: acyltransferase [Mesorhizobium sp.]RWQ08935.1 MAG: acyltransferase [Mesorhizobium sp.]RWQ65633.1 MAG: acyltransferase [Mesorhizobium sp.]